MDQEVLSVLFNSIQEGILTTNNEGKILFCSGSAERLLHTSSVELLKRNISEVLETPEIDEIRPKLQKLKNSDKDSFRLLGAAGRSGDQKQLHIEVRPLAGAREWQALFIITPLHEEADIGHQQLTPETVDIQLIFEGERVVFVSPSVDEFLGYREDEIDSIRSWQRLIHKEDIDGYLQRLDLERSQKSPSTTLNYRIQHKNGKYRQLKAIIIRKYRKNGQMVETNLIADITGAADTEESRGNKGEFIEQLFDASPDLIFVRDIDGKMTYCNKAVAALAGKSREEMLAPDKNMFPASDLQSGNLEEIEREVIRSGQEVVFEEQIPDHQGIPNHYQTIKKPLSTGHGEVKILNISTNINRIKIKEKEIRNVMKVRNDYFSAMSHEIRTPMNAILGMTELLLRRRPRKDQTKLLQTLHFSSNNLLALINDILDFSKIEAGKIEIEHVNFNLHELLENVQESHRNRVADKKLRLDFNIADDVPGVINGDYIKLSQILNNLLSNAIKFTDKGGITVDIGLLASTESGYNLSFTVKDTGIGIAENKLKNIFDPFNQAKKSTTRKYGGTGLGLSIVKNLVEIQKGSINVESVEKEGTVFTITLPFDKADLTLPISSLMQPIVSKFESKINLRVLYVEDVTTNQFLIEEILGDWGVKVEMASDGYKALDIINDKTFDLILMDIQMPGIDGLETTRRIRAREDQYFKDVPIIALTARTADSTKEEIIKCGMQDYIIKPIRVDDLREKIVRYSGKAGALEEIRRIELNTPTVLGEDTKIIFSQTDALFHGNSVRYQRFLNMTIDEFRVNLELLNATIWEDDLTSYRKLRHRMRSMLSTFGMAELLKLMDEIKENLHTGNLTKNQKKEYTASLEQHVNSLIDSMTNKLASLKWQ